MCSECSSKTNQSYEVGRIEQLTSKESISSVEWDIAPGTFIRFLDDEKITPAIEVKFTGTIAREVYGGKFERANPGDAGVDLRTIACTGSGYVDIFLMGVAIALPPGVHAFILSRSSMIVEHGIEVKIGTIDSGYRGEIKVMTNRQTGLMSMGTRIAQLVPSQPLPFVIVDEFSNPDTPRGTGGFGSTNE
jgi:dUTP pyrophosphatase